MGRRGKETHFAVFFENGHQGAVVDAGDFFHCAANLFDAVVENVFGGVGLRYGEFPILARFGFFRLLFAEGETADYRVDADSRGQHDGHPATDKENECEYR